MTKNDILDSLTDSELLTLFGYRQNSLTNYIQAIVNESLKTKSIARHMLHDVEVAPDRLPRFKRNKRTYIISNLDTKETVDFKDRTRIDEIAEGEEYICPHVLLPSEFTVRMNELLARRFYIVDRVVMKCVANFVDMEVDLLLKLLDASSTQHNGYSSVNDAFNHVRESGIKPTTLLCSALTYCERLQHSIEGYSTDSLGSYDGANVYVSAKCQPDTIYFSNQNTGKFIRRSPVYIAHGEPNVDFKASLYAFQNISMATEQYMSAKVTFTPKG